MGCIPRTNGTDALYVIYYVTLGISASRWRLLRRPIIASQERAQWLIKAMCLLHNYLQVHKDQNYCSPGLADSVAEDGSITDGFWRAAQSPLQDLTTSSRRQILRVLTFGRV